MKRTITSIVVSGAILALCCLWTISRASAAEPGKVTEPSKTAAPTKEGEVTAPAEATLQSPEIKEAIDKFKTRDFDGALKLLQQAVKKNPDLPPAEVIMAQLFSQANIPGAVRSYLEKAVVESSNDPEAYVIMGDIALREHRITEAEMLYQKAQSLMAKFNESEKRKDLLEPQILSGLAAVDEARENWSDAQKELEAWLNDRSEERQRVAAACPVPVPAEESDRGVGEAQRGGKGRSRDAYARGHSGPVLRAGRRSGKRQEMDGPGADRSAAKT